MFPILPVPKNIIQKEIFTYKNKLVVESWKRYPFSDLFDGNIVFDRQTLTSLSSNSTTANPARAAPAASPEATQVCFDFAKGRCARPACRFLHEGGVSGRLKIRNTKVILMNIQITSWGNFLILIPEMVQRKQKPSRKESQRIQIKELSWMATRDWAEPGLLWLGVDV